MNIYLTNETAAEIAQILQHHQYDGTFPNQRVAVELFLNAYEQANEAKVTEEQNPVSNGGGLLRQPVAAAG